MPSRGVEGRNGVVMEAEKLHEVTDRLERAEDDFFNLIERYPHLMKEPQTVEIMQEMKIVISDLRTASLPS